MAVHSPLLEGTSWVWLQLSPGAALSSHPPKIKAEWGPYWPLYNSLVIIKGWIIYTLWHHNLQGVMFSLENKYKIENSVIIIRF